MIVTNVKVRKIFEEGPMKAIVSVTFDNCFAVHNVKVIEVEGKTFVTMPSEKLLDGTYRDIAHPINCEFRQNLTKAVIEELSKTEATEQ